MIGLGQLQVDHGHPGVQELAVAGHRLQRAETLLRREPGVQPRRHQVPARVEVAPVGDRPLQRRAGAAHALGARHVALDLDQTVGVDFIVMKQGAARSFQYADAAGLHVAFDQQLIA